MSASQFLSKHKTLINELKNVYPNLSVTESEIHLSNSTTFPAIGLFLGVSSHSPDSRTYVATKYMYILSVFDSIDIDDADDFFKKQQDTFDLIEDVIAKMGYTVLTELEPSMNIANSEGSFMTGWTTTIIFNTQ